MQEPQTNNWKFSSSTNNSGIAKKYDIHSNTNELQEKNYENLGKLVMFLKEIGLFDDV